MKSFALVIAAVGLLAAATAYRSTAGEPTPDETFDRLVQQVWATTTHRTADRPVDLAGCWLLTMPAGFEHRVTLTPMEHGRYRLEPNALNFAGVYIVRDRRFVLEEAIHREDSGYEWQPLNANVLVLVLEPGNRGGRYAGATLTRQVESSAVRSMP